MIVFAKVELSCHTCTDCWLDSDGRYAVMSATFERPVSDPQHLQHEVHMCIVQAERQGWTITDTGTAFCRTHNPYGFQK